MSCVPRSSLPIASLFRSPLFWALGAQSILLFWRLDLLPVWGDEQFTLNIVRMPWREVSGVLYKDIHPPLYFFLAHSWSSIPWPLSPIVQLRALSAVLCLISTITIDRLWLRNLVSPTRCWFLALWTLSPTLLLYSRMGRSYSLQLLGAAVAMYAAWKFLQSPASNSKARRYVIALTVLLYTHYLPGLAVGGAAFVLLALAWRRSRDRDKRVLLRVMAAHGAVALFYLPWMATLYFALTRVARAEPYHLIPNVVLETGVKFAYWFTSFSFGESFPSWAILAGLCLAPGVVWLLWHGKQAGPGWLTLVALTGAIGYAGAVAWVTFAFIGARLLFLLPFFLLLLLEGRRVRPRAGSLVCAGMLIVSMGAISSYFQKSGFLNQGYLVPFRAIAERIESEPAGPGTLVLVDGYNTDPSPLLAAVGDRVKCIRIRGITSAYLARERMRRESYDTIWYLRNTHDISPRQIVTDLERRLAETYGARRYPLVPFSEADRWMSRLLGWAPRSHHYQLTEFRRKSSDATPGPGGDSAMNSPSHLPSPSRTR